MSPDLPPPAVPPGSGPPNGHGPDGATTMRVFGSPSFLRLWIAQVASALGDWLGFVALVAIAARIGGSSPEAAISLVMSARLVPGFFLAPFAGVVVDRWDRKRVMVACDVSRAAVLAWVPFIDTLWALVVASLLLEAATLLWSPAKEASVPNLVRTDYLTTANSLSLVAAYGTFPVASLVFAFLAKVAEWLGGFDSLDFFRLNQESLAIYVDVSTFLVSAFLISTLALPGRSRSPAAAPRPAAGLSQTFQDLKEGWRFMAVNPVVRAVMVALGTGLIGGGMLVPLGPVFADQVLGGGSSAFGLLLTALGSGVAVGVLIVSSLQSRLPKERVFTWAVFVAGASLLGGASMSTLTPALGFVALLGVCAGTVYVLGFTVLHENVSDELRGRIFSSLYTLVRFCLLAAFAVGPLAADRLDRLSARLVDRAVTVAGHTVSVPGVRLTLWVAAVIILGAGVLSVLSLRVGPGRERSEPA
jgi:dTMP kinase